MVRKIGIRGVRREGASGRIVQAVRGEGERPHDWTTLFALVIVLVMLWAVTMFNADISLSTFM